MKHTVDEDWNQFFPPNTRVLALPGWRKPRLYLPTQGFFQRWEQSSLYPASRPGARLYRLVLRFRAAARLAPVRKSRSSCWPLQKFVGDAAPGFASAVVLMGTPGPAQEITVQLRNNRGGVLGYLKYAKKTAARKRLRQEGSMLSKLPDGIGPKLVKIGPLGDGEALLKSPLQGRPLAATLPPPEGLIGLLRTLVVSPPLSLEVHPWVRRMRDSGTPDAWFEHLARRDWPTVIQHGDFVPWNLLAGPDSKLRVIDWEYGTLEGFPYLDLAHYVLQTSALIYRWSPAKAARYAVEYLSRQPELGLGRAEATALTRLTAYDAYRASSEDGQFLDAGLQPWRRAVWEDAVRDA